MIYENYRKLEKFIKNLENKESSLIIILHRAQEIFGYISKDVQEFISEESGIALERVERVIKFYDFFLEEPKSKYSILVCLGVKCAKKSGIQLKKEIEDYLEIEMGKISKDGLFSVRGTECMSACGSGPVVVIGNKLIVKATLEKVIEEIENIRKN